MSRKPARAKPTGRPPIVADHTAVERMIDAISAGVPITQACLHAGISTSAHFRAMEAGELAEQATEAGNTLTDREHAYREYRERIMRARAAVAVVHVALIGKAARGGALVRETTRTYRDEDGRPVTETDRELSRPEWKASAWLLSKSFPGELGDRRAVEHSGPGGGPIEHGAGPAGDALAAIAERLAEVAERQREELPGGWDRPALAAGAAERLPVVDVETVDDDR